MERNLKKYLKASTIMRTAIIVSVILAVCLVSVTVLILTDVLRWNEVVGFVDWLSRATAFGAAFAGLAALTAAWLAYHGVQKTIRAGEAREREKARHERLTTIVTQLASEQAMVRRGGLFAVSALADEWDREARRLIRESPSGGQWESYERDWSLALVRLVNARQELAQNEDGGKIEFALDLEDSLVEAEKLTVDARSRYMLVRDEVPLVATDAVTQRDYCLELVTAYLQTKRLALKSNEMSDGPMLQPEVLSEEQQYDRAVCDAAINIIHRHTVIDAPYPWPGHQINLAWAHLEGIDLSGAHLEGAFMSNIWLDGSNLQGINLNGAILSAASLYEANLSDATLRSANLVGACLDGANLIDADLWSSDCTKASFDNANMFPCSLIGVVLEGAYLQSAGMHHDHTPGNLVVSLAEVTDAGKLVYATWDHETVWPEWADPGAALKSQVEWAESEYKKSRTKSH